MGGSTLRVSEDTTAFRPLTTNHPDHCQESASVASSLRDWMTLECMWIVASYGRDAQTCQEHAYVTESDDRAVTTAVNSHRKLLAANRGIRLSTARASMFSVFDSLLSARRTASVFHHPQTSSPYHSFGDHLLCNSPFSATTRMQALLHHNTRSSKLWTC